MEQAKVEDPAKRRPRSKEVGVRKKEEVRNERRIRHVRKRAERGCSGETGEIGRQVYKRELQR